uniref:FH2 domain-containing protein n=1 Tax=Meloidogyne incognita TaxID=6306 RepID=A0A914LWZ7_MELIC
MRLDAMLLRLDIEELMDNSGQNCGLETWLKGGEELMSSPSLHKILYILLHVGNYLNHGASIGNAVGFKLSSLWKVEDVKAIGGAEKGRRSTLLHFVAKQANNCAEELIAELGNVRESVKSSLDATKEDLRGLIERQQRLEGEIKEIQNNDIFFGEYKQFLEKSGNYLKKMEDQLAKFEPLRLKLANFFCEPERTFSLEECFKIIASFIERFEKAVQENKQWSSLDNQSVKTTETDAKTTLNPTKINRSTSPNPSIISDNNNLFLSNFVNNPSLEVPSGVESLRRRRNSAFPTFELKIKENEEKKGNDDCNVKISENNSNSNPPPNNHSQKQQNQEESSTNEAISKSNISTTPQPSSTQPQQTNPPVDASTTNPPPSSPALVRLSRDAKQCLADSSIEKKKEIKNNKVGQVAKRIDHYEHQGLQKPSQQRSGISRLSSISKVRTGNSPAIVQVKNNLENNNETGIQRPTPFRRNQTLTPTSCRNLSSKIASNVEKQKEALQAHKAKIHSSPLITRAASQQISNISRRQQLQNLPKSNKSSPVTKSKPVLTRQVSTASRPILIHSSGGGSTSNNNNNNNNNTSSSSDKKTKAKWI